MSALPLAKFVGIFVRQVAKPISVRLQTYVGDHPKLRAHVITIGQSLHFFNARVLRLSEGVEFQYIVNQPQTRAWAQRPSICAAEMRTYRSEDPGTLLTKGQSVELVSDDPEGEYQQVQWKQGDGSLADGWIPKMGAAWYSGPTLVSKTKPLMPEEAVKQGTAFISEVFIFSVAAGWLVYELSNTAKENQKKAEATKAEMARRDIEIAKLKQLADEDKTRRAIDLRTMQTELQKVRLQLEAVKAESQATKLECDEKIISATKHLSLLGALTGFTFIVISDAAFIGFMRRRSA